MNIKTAVVSNELIVKKLRFNKGYYFEKIVLLSQPDLNYIIIHTNKKYAIRNSNIWLDFEVCLQKINCLRLYTYHLLQQQNRIFLLLEQYVLLQYHPVIA